MKSTSPFLGRFVAVGTAVITLALALLPVIGNLDWRSTVGVLGGIGAILGVTLKWLSGLQAHEARTAPLWTPTPGTWTQTPITTGSATGTMTINTVAADRDPSPPVADPDAADENLDDPGAGDD